MARSTSEKGKFAKALVAKHPKTPSATLARILVKERPAWFKSLDSARCMIRYCRGNLGERNRKVSGDRTAFRPNGEAGKAYCPPPSLADVWRPHLFNKAKKPLLLSDIHSPYHDVKALRVAVQYGIDQGCDGVILNGDIGDFYGLSRYDKDPDRRNFKDEMLRLRDLLTNIREKFPKKPIVYKAGNHEERLDHFIWAKAPELWGLEEVRLPNILGLDKLGIEFVTDRRYVLFRGAWSEDERAPIGGLPIFHGHELGGAASAVNQARGSFLRTVHTMIAGHGHRTSHHVEDDMFHTKEISCWSVGALCDLHPHYARVNKWNHGLAVLHSEGDDFLVENRRISRMGRVW